MRTYHNSTRRELIRTLQTATEAIRRGMVDDFEDVALLFRPFRAIAIEGEPDQREAESKFDSCIHEAADGQDRPTERGELLELVSNPDPRIDTSKAESDRTVGYPQYTRRDMMHALRCAVRAIRLGMVHDLEDCAIVVHAVREIAIRDCEDKDESAMQFDTTIGFGHEGLDDEERRAKLVAFIASQDPRAETLLAG